MTVSLSIINENLVEVRWADGAQQARLEVAHQTHRMVQRVDHVAGTTWRVTLFPVDQVPPIPGCDHPETMTKFGGAIICTTCRTVVAYRDNPQPRFTNR